MVAVENFVVRNPLEVQQFLNKASARRMIDATPQWDEVAVMTRKLIADSVGLVGTARTMRGLSFQIDKELDAYTSDPPNEYARFVLTDEVYEPPRFNPALGEKRIHAIRTGKEILSRLRELQEGKVASFEDTQHLTAINVAQLRYAVSCQETMSPQEYPNDFVRRFNGTMDSIATTAPELLESFMDERRRRYGGIEAPAIPLPRRTRSTEDWPFSFSNSLWRAATLKRATRTLDRIADTLGGEQTPGPQDVPRTNPSNPLYVNPTKTINHILENNNEKMAKIKGHQSGNGQESPSA